MISEDSQRRIAGFMRCAERFFGQGTCIGWRVHRDTRGWSVEMRDPGGTVYAGTGETIGFAIQALVEGLDWMIETEEKAGMA